jgi:glycosyltransferase involved in cell wall biosynthesis
VETYGGPVGLAWRAVCSPFRVARLAKRLHRLGPDFAICVHPGPLDLQMAAALRRQKVPFLAIVHDADLHPGDGLPFQMELQRALWRRAVALCALTTHVAERLVRQGLAGGSGPPLIRLRHPPMPCQLPAAEQRSEVVRVLSFGRLLPYKGLDLLADALRRLGPRTALQVRVVGSGPASPVLDELRNLPGVSVENRWVPEEEIGGLLAWSDAVVLPYREASQSGVAAFAIGAGRWVIATDVGGLAEQLAGESRVLLCRPDGAALAACLEQLLSMPGSAFDPPVRDSMPAWREIASDLRRSIAGLLNEGDSHSQIADMPQTTH